MMDIEHWQRLRRLTEHYAALPREQADAWLAEVEPDPELRRQVVSMAACDEDTHHSLNVALTRSLPTTNRAQQRVGPWELLRLLGEGGMGSVWLAQRIEGGFAQTAALKFIRFGLHADAVRRFEVERTILARLRHPGIATLLDGGATDQGQPWLALEYIEGQDIVSWSDGQKLSLSARIRLFVQVCDAVAYAHRQLIIHRDIKPANVLVSDTGQVKLLDFGVAKLLDPELDPALTGTHVAPMTPAYAAPEQISGEPVSTQTDVYALGLLLYRLLCGLLPQAGRTGSPAEARAAVLDSDPTPPSAALTKLATDATQRQQIAELRALRPSDLSRQLRGDLDAILLKCLRREPEQRYASVEALREDLQRHLEQQPVLARRGSRRYLAGRFVARNRLPVALAAMMLMSLLAGLLLTTVQSQRLAAERDYAVQQELRANTALAFQRELFRLANPRNHGGEEPTASALLDLGERLIEDGAGRDPWVRASLLEEMARARSGMGNYARATELAQSAYDGFQALGDDLKALELQTRLAALETNTGIAHEAWERIKQVFAHPSFPQAPASVRALALTVRGVAQGNAGEREAAVQDLLASAELHRLSQDSVNARSYIVNRSAAAFFLTTLDRGTEALEVLAETETQIEHMPGGRAASELELEIAYMNTYRMLNRWDEVEQRASRLLDAARAVYGDRHPTVASRMTSLGQALLRGGRSTQAIDFLTRALDINLETKGEHSAQTRFARQFLGEAYLKHGNLAAAREHLLLASSTAADYPGPDSSYLSTRSVVVYLFESEGKLDAAVEEIQRISAEVPDALADLAAVTRTRLEVIRLRHAEAGSDQPCAAYSILDTGDSASAALLKTAYHASCLRRSGEDTAAQTLIDGLDWSPLLGQPRDPAVRRVAAEAGVDPAQFTWQPDG